MSTLFPLQITIYFQLAINYKKIGGSAEMEKRQGNWDSISFAIISFILIISMWWQYFDNMEKELKKSRQTSGQIIIYGHLLILMSLSMVAHPLDYYFTWGPIFFYPIFLFLDMYCSILVNYNYFSSIHA